MEGARFLALLLYFEGRVEGRGVIAPLKRDALRMYTHSLIYSPRKEFLDFLLSHNQINY